MREHPWEGYALTWFQDVHRIYKGFPIFKTEPICFLHGMLGKCATVFCRDQLWQACRSQNAAVYSGGTGRYNLVDLISAVPALVSCCWRGILDVQKAALKPIFGSSLETVPMISCFLVIFYSFVFSWCLEIKNISPMSPWCPLPTPRPVPLVPPLTSIPLNFVLQVDLLLLRVTFGSRLMVF